MHTIKAAIPHSDEGEGVLQQIIDSSLQHTEAHRQEKASRSLCYWLISQVRVGNWLTQWQRSHLSHHWQPTALSSSNFLRRYQIVPMIASSQPGSGSFHDSMLFPLSPTSLIHSLPISLKGALKVVTNLGLLREINRVDYPSVWTLTNWAKMTETFISDYSLCQLHGNTLANGKISKHAESLDISGHPERAPWSHFGKWQ